jgi:aspartyl/asparaginyl beta-hydroxylase (cupin superfamily)
VENSPSVCALLAANLHVFQDLTESLDANKVSLESSLANKAVLMEAKDLHHFVSAIPDHVPFNQSELFPHLVVLNKGLSSLRDSSVSLLLHDGGVSTVNWGKLAP